MLGTNSGLPQDLCVAFRLTGCPIWPSLDSIGVLVENEAVITICTLRGHQYVHHLHSVWSSSTTPCVVIIICAHCTEPCSVVVAALVARTLCCRCCCRCSHTVVAHTLCCRCSHALLSLLTRSAVVARVLCCRCLRDARFAVVARTLCCRCSHALIIICTLCGHHLSRATLLSLMQNCISVVQHCSHSCNTASQCQSCNAALSHAILHLSCATLHLSVSRAMLSLMQHCISVVQHCISLMQYCISVVWSSSSALSVLVDSVALSCAGRLCTRCCSLLLITGVDHSLTRC